MKKDKKLNSIKKQLKIRNKSKNYKKKLNS